MPLEQQPSSTVTVSGITNVNPFSLYPSGSTPVNASSGNQANANAVATLPAAVGKNTYISGFSASAGGATAGLCVTLTVAGVTNGPLSYTFVYPAGATTAARDMEIFFPIPLQSSAQNTAIVVTLPAGGAGNTNATVSAWGYQQ